MLLFSFDGSLLFRFAERQFCALLFQLPPRFARFSPDYATTPKCMFIFQSHRSSQTCVSLAMRLTAAGSLTRICDDNSRLPD